MIKNNPNTYLRSQGISVSQISEAGRKMLQVFDKAEAIYLKYPMNASHQKNTEEIGASAIAKLKQEVILIKENLIHDEGYQKEEALKKEQSKKVIEKSKAVFSDLELCREKLREERRQKLADGTIPKPKKRSLSTRLRNSVFQIAAMTPKQLRGKEDILTLTKKAINKFVTELQSIWGINKIKPIQDGLAEKFKKMEEAASNYRNN